MRPDDAIRCSGTRGGALGRAGATGIRGVESGDLRDRIRALRVDEDTQASDHQPVLIDLG